MGALFKAFLCNCLACLTHTTH
uniref:Uncharacterized protein n=1 Tax=Anguilla anguilla TaxID=7936 RepID=A0A0E9SYY3_ANGAN